MNRFDIHFNGVVDRFDLFLNWYAGMYSFVFKTLFHLIFQVSRAATLPIHLAVPILMHHDMPRMPKILIPEVPIPWVLPVEAHGPRRLIRPIRWNRCKCNNNNKYSSNSNNNKHNNRYLTLEFATWLFLVILATLGRFSTIFWQLLSDLTTSTATATTTNTTTGT